MTNSDPGVAILSLKSHNNEPEYQHTYKNDHHFKILLVTWPPSRWLAACSDTFAIFEKIVREELLKECDARTRRKYTSDLISGENAPSPRGNTIGRRR